MGWADLDDGPLLNAMADRFDVLVTVDKNLPKQQRIDNRPLAVIGTIERKQIAWRTYFRSFPSFYLCWRRPSRARFTKSPT